MKKLKRLREEFEYLVWMFWVNDMKSRLKKFGFMALIGLGFWIWNTLVLKFGLGLGINIWFITAFNVGFGSIVKFLLLEKVFQ